MLLGWLKRRHYRKKNRGLARKAWDPEIRAHIESLEKYHKDISRPVARAKRFAIVGNIISIIGYCAVALSYGLLGWMSLPLMTPISVVEFFSPERADLWKRSRETGCLGPLLEWRTSELIGADSLGWKMETWRCIMARQKRNA